MAEKQIAAALVAAQRKFGPLLRDRTNPHFKSRYADLATCLDVVQGPLNECGIALVQMTHECSDGVIVETVLIHETGEELTVGRLHVPASKQDAQGYGSALTYARRYSLMAAMGIAPEDDDGNAATAAPPARQQQVPQPTRAAAPGTLEPSLAKLLGEFNWPAAVKTSYAAKLLGHFGTTLEDCRNSPELARMTAAAVEKVIAAEHGDLPRLDALQILFASLMETAK